MLYSIKFPPGLWEKLSDKCRKEITEVADKYKIESEMDFDDYHKYVNRNYQNINNQANNWSINLILKNRSTILNTVIVEHPGCRIEFENPVSQKFLSTIQLEKDAAELSHLKNSLAVIKESLK